MIVIYEKGTSNYDFQFSFLHFKKLCGMSLFCFGFPSGDQFTINLHRKLDPPALTFIKFNNFLFFSFIYLWYEVLNLQKYVKGTTPPKPLSS